MASFPFTKEVQAVATSVEEDEKEEEEEEGEEEVAEDEEVAEGLQYELEVSVDVVAATD